MKIVRTYKYKLKPSKTVIVKFEHCLSVCREVYNSGLQERRDAWQLERKSISFYDQSRQLPQIKKIREDVAEVQSQVLQNILRRLERTFQAFFKRIKKGEKAGYPRFKNEKRFNSFTYPQMKNAFHLVGNKLTLSKIGSVRLHLSREIAGKIKTCTIKREVSGWFVFFMVEQEVEPLPKIDNSIGLDMGIENFLTMSDGTQIENPRFFEHCQKEIRVAQRRVARRQKDSNRRRKSVIQIGKLYEKIKNSRNDFQHKISRTLVNDFDFIAIENLNIVGMSKGFLAKQVSDVAWGNFFRKLLYKAESAGREVVEINPSGTSQTCVCGHRVEKTLNMRWHQCSNCGLSCHRDIVSAQVILNRAVGQTVKALSKSIELLAFESSLLNC